MKNYLLAGAALAAFSFGAQAADLPRRVAAPAPVFAAPVFTWAGFYVGLNAGAGFRTNNNNGNGVFVLPGGTVVGSPGTNGVLTVPTNNGNQASFVGGGQIGYNFQFGSFVPGFEADFQYRDRNRLSGVVAPFPTYAFVGAPGLAFAPPPATVVTGFGSTRQNYFGTVRGRLGYAIDRTLIYATGGIAYTGSNSRIGYSIGGGVEYAFSNNFSVKLEGLYVGLRRNNNNGAVVFNLATNTLFVGDGARRRDEFVVVRAGVNYRFGAPAGPVFAKY